MIYNKEEIVEYAIETVRRGSLAIGIKTKNGIILAAEEKSKKKKGFTGR